MKLGKWKKVEVTVFSILIYWIPPFPRNFIDVILLLDFWSFLIVKTKNVLPDKIYHSVLCTLVLEFGQTFLLNILLSYSRSLNNTRSLILKIESMIFYLFDSKVLKGPFKFWRKKGKTIKVGEDYLRRQYLNIHIILDDNICK